MQPPCSLGASHMTFQFLCPQGHLLEGDEAHMGMQCQCPQCGAAFIIPTIDQPGQSSAPGGGAPSPAAQVELEQLAPLDSPDDIETAVPEPAEAVEAAPSLEADDVLESELGGTAVDEAMLHIPCPNGHELETPLDMVGQRAMCPHCGVEFRLKRERSVEYQRQQEILERRRAKFWFQLAIVVAGFVGVVLLAMAVMMVVM